MLFANGNLQVRPFTIRVVEGSKIWPCNTCCCVQGLMTGCKKKLASVNVRPGPSRAEKSPLRSAAVGKVCTLLDKPLRLRYCSQAKKKNVFSVGSKVSGSTPGRRARRRSRSAGHAASCCQTNESSRD